MRLYAGISSCTLVLKQDTMMKTIPFSMLLLIASCLILFQARAMDPCIESHNWSTFNGVKLCQDGSVILPDERRLSPNNQICTKQLFSQNWECQGSAAIAWYKNNPTDTNFRTKLKFRLGNGNQRTTVDESGMITYGNGIVRERFGQIKVPDYMIKLIQGSSIANQPIQTYQKNIKGPECRTAECTFYSTEGLWRHHLKKDGTYEITVPPSQTQKDSRFTVYTWPPDSFQPTANVPNPIEQQFIAAQFKLHV